ncbi:aldehyde dehydrogenase family protein [Pseudorhodoplanes sinuspersici]|uniref:aldehyde dehydrogenase family protein n=1 Tax=Pseudorhodoplanes sinuspersici TaxID=1235591 RepID=UPI000FF4E1F1|nr:aldehyde dehydrogenase family protein [Pseudorhodoplanes sinuspersici]RKE71161.1 acyl-CoA reductase-like NAD-dependent aldehyde dehydrogenase [Pseudorhodoplanes sinuspersici]
MQHSDSLFIAEPFVPGHSKPKGAVLKTFVRPQDGVHIGDIVESGAEGVAVAVASSRAAFRAFKSSSIHDRMALLKQASDAIRGSAADIAKLICEDVGKPIKAANFEANRGCDFIDACIAAVSQLRGEVLPLDAVATGRGLTGFTKRVPYGVVGGITPFNAPVNLLLQKVMPAVAVGNAIVVKPALSGSRVATQLAKLFLEAGWPQGLFNVVTGDRETALALAAHPDVDAISFTGGTAAGHDLVRAAGAKKFVAELGSNAANIVLGDADLKFAATRIASAGFEASGQQCISAQRVLVQRSVLGEFLALFTAAAKAMKVGLASDPATDVGPMVHLAAAERVMSMVEDAVAKGATVALKPERDGATVSPGILVDIAKNSRLWKDEVFGPIVAVVPFDMIDEAIELANDSDFGLQGAVFTQGLSHALRFAEDMDVGSLWINEASRFRLDMYPFGGVKQSGIGREGVVYAMEELSQVKFIGIRSQPLS